MLSTITMMSVNGLLQCRVSQNIGRCENALLQDRALVGNRPWPTVDPRAVPRPGRHGAELTYQGRNSPSRARLDRARQPSSLW